MRVAAALLVLPLAGCSLSGSSSDGPGADAPPAGSDAVPAPSPSPTATAVPGGLGPEFFGMHDADPVGESWPDAPVGSLRVWDSGVAWSQIETAPGVYDFTRLDAIVTTARERKAKVVIVLGQTPTFHSRKPKKVGAYGKGAASMPRLGAWRAYLQAVVTKYAADDVAFQVWNEANVEGYWNGTPRQMARLTAVAREVVDSVTPAPTLVGPALATRTLGQRSFLRLFYAERVGGAPVADLFDVVSLQLYPEAGEGPERISALLSESRRLMADQGVAKDKPIWNTEVNFGLQGGVPATPASPERQQANVATTYLLNAADGVAQVYWYSWDLHAIADTDLVEADNTTLTPAGRAFGVVSRWLVGSVVQSCRDEKDGTWVCTLQTPTGPARAYWNPKATATVRTSFQATAAETIGAPALEVPLGGTTLQVGEVPVLVSASASGSSGLPPRV